MYWLAFSRLLSLLCRWISKYFLKYSFWRFWSGIFSINSIRKFWSLVITLTCLILHKQFSTQSQDDCEDSFEELSSIRRSWSSLDDSTEVWLDESNCNYVLTKLIICYLRLFPMSKFAIIFLILEFGVICPFLPHLKHFISSLFILFFEEKFWYFFIWMFLVLGFSIEGFFFEIWKFFI